MSQHAHTSRLPLPLILASAVLIASLFAVGMAAAAQEKPQAQPGDKEAVPLRWRLVSGKDFFQELTTEATQTLTVLEMKVTQQLPSFTFWSRWRVAPRVTVITLPRLVLWFLPCAGGVAVDGVALSRPSE